MLFLNGLKHNNVILGPSVIKGVAVLSQYVTKTNGKDVGLSYYHNLWRAVYLIRAKIPNRLIEGTPKM